MFDFKNYINDIPDFPKPGIIFKDIQPLLSNGEVFDKAIIKMLNLVHKPDYFVGVDSRGFIFASAMASKTQNGLKLVRKKGKLPPPCISINYDLEYGNDTLEIQEGKGKVVIVDDVCATGGTISSVEQLCVKAGYQVIDKVVLIDLAFLHKLNDIKSLIKYE
jgi:adenine phosphoribosyltransferase